MQNIFLKNIKFTSIKSIFSCIAASKNISRAEISEKTHLSVVTVGKIVDALIDLDIVHQSKVRRPVAGRRAGVLNVNKQKYVIIFDLTLYNFKAIALDLTLNTIDSYDFKYDNLTTFTENLTSFIKKSKAFFFKKFSEENCIGIGTTVPGTYDKEADSVRSPQMPEMIVVPIREIFEKHFPKNIIQVESNVISAGRINVEEAEEFANKDIVYLYFGNHSVSGAHFINGELVGGRSNSACDFGRMILDADITLEERFRLCKSENDCAPLLAGAVYNIFKIISPHSFIFEYDLSYKTEKLNDLIEDILIQKYKLPKPYIPEFVPATFKLKNSHCGLAITIRENWIKKMALDD